ncbi:MAG: N-acetylmuramoyl-L-alanine amidase-like domain-containing protein [Bacteroidota bacterium]
MIYNSIIKKRPMFFGLMALGLFISCNSTTKNLPAEPESIIFQPKDKAILEQVLNQFSAAQKEPASVLMVKVGSSFQGTPYVAHTLETEEEQLVINLRELDCTTFAENCLAISRTIKSESPTFEQFTAELQIIRYRDGNINGYPSRLHYFCDWIFHNQQKNLIEDMSEEITQSPLPKHINYMSTHPDSYRQLKENPLLVEIIAEQEQEISAREMFFIPETLLSEVESKLMDGDIVGITTGMEGIAISHVGILIRKAGRIHLMHASSLAEKVVISEKTLEEYLLNSKSATGIMVARPL